MAQAARTELLETLQRLLEIPAADLKVALTQACDAIAAAVNADKVDAFIYQPESDCLVAVGSSTQPLSAKQRRHGLDVLQVANGGRVVHVYQTGQTYVTGHLEDDTEELRGIREALEIRSKIGVPLEVGGSRRGMIMIAALRPEAFTPEDVKFAEAVARWVGAVAHRAELVQEIERNAVEQGRRLVAEELITVLAHDLRNYISTIEYRVRAIRRKAELEGRDAEVRDCDAAQRSIGRLGSLVSDILDAARIDQGVLQLDPRPVELTPLVNEVIDTLGTTQHRIVTKISEDLLVAADPKRVCQCLENILANAVQHSPDDAPVTVFIRRVKRENDDVARIDIVDEGPGIAPELLPRIFERFVTGKQRKGGLGLGLYLAKRIATLHNGDLTVESKLGGGAQFTLLLPCYRDDVHVARRRTTGEQPEP
ncbi:MAG TPA: GAF domain-containing sensor histidine kinase [Gammaproteobacteria bacterium]|nr:GAF domain-containing sensor histidine kinase [Gammaproteobacteria bacterium]